MELYKNIKERRLELGLTQTELAQKMGYADKSMIAKVEKGLVDLPQSKIIAFAKALDIKPGDLMGWGGEADTPAYYLNEETAAIAQEIFDNPELRALFDVSRNATPDDLLMARDILTALQKRERND